MEKRIGALAQMGERLLCKQDVIGSIPIGSTNSCCRWALSGQLLPTGMGSAPSGIKYIF